MFGLKLELMSLFICGILHVSMSVHAKKEMGLFMLKKNHEIKHNLREGEIYNITTTQQMTKNCVCSKVYDPVCGTNNISYYNICQLQCENQPGSVDVLHQGNCIPFKKH